MKLRQDTSNLSQSVADIAIRVPQWLLKQVIIANSKVCFPREREKWVVFHLAVVIAKGH